MFKATVTAASPALLADLEEAIATSQFCPFRSLEEDLCKEALKNLRSCRECVRTHVDFILRKEGEDDSM